MGVVLGLDGKERAAQAAAGLAVSPATISTLYVGLLETLPADADGLSLSALVTGNEHTPSADWYLGGRFALDPGDDLDLAVDEDGATLTSNVLIEWANDQVTDEDVAGLFVTDAASGTSGLVLWVGGPDVGGQVAAAGGSAKILAGDLVLRVD